MQAMTDPRVTHVSLMKSARVGYTLMVSAAVGYYVHQSPCSILFVEPTVDDVRAFSRETIAPMIRDVPVLRDLMAAVADEDPDATNSTQSKQYPGGVLSLVGANSGNGFRRRSCKVAILDEVDSYPPSAGADGDPVKLAAKRTEYFWDRKIIAGSTPLIAGHSKIEALFLAGDQRRFYVPCPQCGHMDYFVFSHQDAGGHWMEWPRNQPEAAHFVCSKNGCVIEHHHKRDMVAAGEWRGALPFNGHASFHIWAAYSYSPNTSWGQIAREFTDAKAGGLQQLKTFVNTWLAETWKESGEAPEWERLYNRREHYQIGTVPDGVKFLTAGVDVQKDRWVYEVVGWGLGKESWSIDAGVIPGDPSKDSDWQRVDELLGRVYSSSVGEHTIRMLAVDSGYNTQAVYNWARRHERSRVMAVKGHATARTLISTPTPVDVLSNGKLFKRGGKVWPVGTDIAKSELYGWLRLGEPAPGFCHFPEHEEEFFRQLTGEHLVSSTNKRGFSVHEWQVIPGRQNHWLDCRVYARAAAAVLGLDRMAARPPTPAVSPPPAVAPEIAPPVAALPPVPAPPRPPPAPTPEKPKSDSVRFHLVRERVRGDWLKKRR